MTISSFGFSSTASIIFTSLFGLIGLFTFSGSLFNWALGILLKFSVDLLNAGFSSTGTVGAPGDTLRAPTVKFFFSGGVCGTSSLMETLRIISGAENNAGPKASARWAGGFRFSLFGYLGVADDGVVVVVVIVVVATPGFCCCWVGSSAAFDSLGFSLSLSDCLSSTDFFLR